MSARIILAAITACTLIGISDHKTPLVVWNATASAPVGFYLVVSHGKIHRGNLVFAWPPASTQRLAAERGYLPLGVPLVKHVAAMARDCICGRADRITINGHVAAIRHLFDSQHRPLPVWTGCQSLGNSTILLLNADVPASFDGRYFGPISTAAIIGKLVPLWIR